MTTQSYQGASTGAPQTTPPAAQTNPQVERTSKMGFAVTLFLGFLIVFIVGVLAGGIQWWLLTQYKKDQSAVAPPKQSSTQPASPGGATSTTAPADDASKALSQRVATASHDERQPISEALAIAENSYPSDYRFPFEHAKLVVAGNVHHHAFGLLFMAATRAIESGKADLMLSDVEREKDGAFYRCSRGHDEWKTLEDSLRNKDKTILQNAMAGMHRDLIGGSDDMAMAY